MGDDWSDVWDELNAVKALIADGSLRQDEFRVLLHLTTAVVLSLANIASRLEKKTD